MVLLGTKLSCMGSNILEHGCRGGPELGLLTAWLLQVARLTLRAPGVQACSGIMQRQAQRILLW